MTTSSAIGRYETVSEMLDEVCQKYATRSAFVDVEDNKFTYRDFYFLIIRFSEMLLNQGIEPGESVSVHVTDPSIHVVARLALLRVGAVSIPMPLVDAHREGLVKHVLVDQTVGKSHPKDIAISSAWFQHPERFVPIRKGGRICHSTSGTTGTPKLRMDSDSVLMARLYNGLDLRGPILGNTLIAYNTRTLIGIKVILSTLWAGHTFFLLRKTHEASLRTITDYKIRHLFVPPAQLRLFATVAEERHLHFPPLESVHSGGGAVSPDFAAHCEKAFGAAVYTEYGSTETDTLATHRPATTPEQPNTAGRLLEKFEARFSPVTEDTLSGLSELFVRVPAGLRTTSVPNNIPIADRDGWIGTGDLASFDRIGRLVLFGRKSDLINVGGNKFSPEQLEMKIRKLLGLDELAVFALPDTSGIDDVGIAIPISQVVDKKMVLEVLSSSFSETLRFQVIGVNAIPRNDAGKVDRLNLMVLARKVS